MPVWAPKATLQLCGGMPPCSPMLQHLMGQITDAVAASAPSPPPWTEVSCPCRDDVCRRERQRWDGGSQQVPWHPSECQDLKTLCHWSPSHHPQHCQNLLQGAQKTASLQRRASPFPSAHAPFISSCNSFCTHTPASTEAAGGRAAMAAGRSPRASNCWGTSTCKITIVTIHRQFIVSA